MISTTSALREMEERRHGRLTNFFITCTCCCGIMNALTQTLDARAAVPDYLLHSMMQTRKAFLALTIMRDASRSAASTCLEPLQGSPMLSLHALLTSNHIIGSLVGELQILLDWNSILDLQE